LARCIVISKLVQVQPRISAGSTTVQWKKPDTPQLKYNKDASFVV
jgi:hypothetical protein